MKPIIFARVADMKRYNGVKDDDVPVNGGSWVNINKNAHECHNFTAVQLDGDPNEYFLGYTQLMGGIDSQLHIEHIVGCEKLANEEKAENVIVVFCSKARNSKSTRVVGFYKNATVYREAPEYNIDSDDDDGYYQYFYFIAKTKDCVLIPYQERFKTADWFVPTSGKMGYSFGFGHSNIWYAGANTNDKKEIAYVNKMIERIENYNGENWV